MVAKRKKDNDDYVTFVDAEDVVRKGIILHWGVDTVWDATAECAFNHTVVFIKESNSGEVFKVIPDTITFEKYDNSDEHKGI